MIKEGIQKLIKNSDLTYQESEEIMEEIMSGEATPAQIGAFLAAHRMKGETIQEISAFASLMREFCDKIHPHIEGRLTDTCGTGAAKIKTFNISTISAFVAAGAEVSVAKHGNRSVTSKCGSADVLEQLGLNLDLNPEGVEKMIEEVGMGFMFAPKFHPAMKYAITPRREMGVRTVFNILGPLTNPAGADAQVLGVYSKEWVEPLGHVLKELGCEEAMVVHGVDGLDEISTIGKTWIAWLRDGEVSLLEKSPEDFGFRTAKPDEIRGASPEKSAHLTYKLLTDQLKGGDARRDIVLLNAAASILVGGKAETIHQGVELAEESIETGKAYRKLKMMVKASGGNLSKLEKLEKGHA